MTAQEWLDARWEPLYQYERGEITWEQLHAAWKRIDKAFRKAKQED